MPAEVVTTVSSILAPGRLGFQASAVASSIDQLAGPAAPNASRER